LHSESLLENAHEGKFLMPETLITVYRGGFLKLSVQALECDSPD